MAAATPTEQLVRADLVRVVEGEDGDCEGVEGVGTSVVAVVVPIRSVKLSSNYVTFHRIYMLRLQYKLLKVCHIIVLDCFIQCLLHNSVLVTRRMNHRTSTHPDSTQSFH